MLKFKMMLLLAVSLAACSFAYAADSAASSISAAELKKEIKSGHSVVILDVRMPEELNGALGKIDGSINIPLQQLQSRLNELNKYKDKKIYVISRSGIPSKLAAEMLEKHGFTAVVVTGGMMAYRQSGE